MMMSDLPLDLVENILSRVPATTLVRLRLTCKRWNALIKDGGFTMKHVRKAAKDSMVLMLKEHRVCPVNVNLNIAPPSIEFQGALCLNSEPVDIVQVFHCDGLLLCTTKDNRLVVWNPCLGETRWIQLKDDYYYKRDDSMFSLGYVQNNESFRSYKILWTWYCDDAQDREVSGFEMYEFSSDSWRVLDDVNHNSTSIMGCDGVSLKGNTYCLAYHPKEKSSINLFSFNFTTERFKRMCLPHFQDARGGEVLSVVREEQLSVLHWSRKTSKIEIWVTTNIDSTEATLLWRLHLNTRGKCVRVFSSLLIDEEKKAVLCCNVGSRSSDVGYRRNDYVNETSKNLVYIIGDGVEDDGHYIEVPYVEPNNIQSVLLLRHQKWHIVIFNYVPSLVQIH